MQSKATTDRMYRGQLIRECCWAKGEHAGKWIVQTYHQTGMQWSDEECPHYWTLADARAAIDEYIEYQEQYA